MEHLDTTIRRIARLLTHEPNITDAQITTVARAQGWHESDFVAGKEVKKPGPVVDDLGKLTFMQRFSLGKHMIFQAEIGGLSNAEMAGTRSPIYQ